MKLPFGRSNDRGESQERAAAIERITQQLDRLIELIERTNDLLQRRTPDPSETAQQASVLSGELAAADPQAERPVGGSRNGDAAGRDKRASAGGRRRETAAERPLRLHEAIIHVLETAGEPLSAHDIAERIRTAGLYEPPRSGHELRSGQVSARVGNATYRDRFVRRDGRIWLDGRT